MKSTHLNEASSDCTAPLKFGKVVPWYRRPFGITLAGRPHPNGAVPSFNNFRRLEGWTPTLEESSTTYTFEAPEAAAP